jgi:hypothetical protein
MYHIFALPDSPNGASSGGGGGSKCGSGDISSSGGGGGAAAADGAAGRLLASIRADPAYIHRCECVWVCPGVIVWGCQADGALWGMLLRLGVAGRC